MIVVNEKTTLESALQLMGYELVAEFANEIRWSNRNVTIQKIYTPGKPQGNYAVRIEVEHPFDHAPTRVLEMQSRRWTLAAILHVIDACWAGRREF